MFSCARVLGVHAELFHGTLRLRRTCLIDIKETADGLCADAAFLIAEALDEEGKEASALAAHPGGLLKVDAFDEVAGAGE